MWPNLINMPLVKSGSVDIPPRQSTPPRKSLLDRLGDYLSTAGILFFSNLLRYDSKARWTAKKANESEWLQEKPFPTKKVFMPKIFNGNAPL